MTSRQPTTDPRWTAFWVGLAAVTAQALLLRESMAAMGGSELSWGVVMALWLVGTGAGSRLGIRRGTQWLAVWTPVVSLVLAGTGMVLLRAAPALLGTAPGETVTTSSALWLWAAAIVPSALVGGLAFPILAGAMGSGGGGRAYGFESAGALVGGIALSLLLAQVSAAGSLCLGLAAVLAVTAWSRNSLVVGLLAAAALAGATVAGAALARSGWIWAGHPGELRSWMETRHQRIAVSKGPPTSVYADGRLIATYPDPYSVLPRAHLVMLLHPRPRTVLSVGGMIDGSIEAMGRHPLHRLTVVEEDAELLHTLPNLYGEPMKTALDGPPVRALAEDPVRALDDATDLDLIVLFDGNPSTLRKNRTRTREFLLECRNSLKHDGVLVMRVAAQDTYTGGVGGRLVSVLASTVAEVFERRVVIPGQEILIVAGGIESEITLNHGLLQDRLAASGLPRDVFPPEMIPLLVDQSRSVALEDDLSDRSPLNTVEHPRAVLLAGALHEARALPGLLAAVAAVDRRGTGILGLSLCVAAALLLASSLFPRAAVGASAATVGFCSMGWWLLLISIWQSSNGSVYSEIGALTGLFMAGLAVGSLAASRLHAPEQAVASVLAAGVVLSAALALGAATAAATITVPALLAVGGLLTGAAFPGLTRLGPSDTRRAAGVVFGFDELGAAAAALVIGILVIPWAGLTATASGLAFMQAAAIPAVLVQLRRRRTGA